MKKLLTILLILLPAVILPLQADSRLSPVFTGGCNSNGMLLKGLDAATYNPALLAFSDGYQHSFTLLPINFSLESSVEKSIYDDYFASTSKRAVTVNGKKRIILTTADQDAILDAIGDGFALNLDAKSSLFGLQLGREAYALNIYNHVDVFLPDDLIDFVLKGNEFNKAYKFNDTKAEMYNLASAEYSFSDKLENRVLNNVFKEITVGATFRYMYGFPTAPMNDDSFIDLDDDNVDIKPAYIKINNFQGQFLTSDITDSNSTSHGATSILATYDILVSEAGQGLGVDVGTAIQVTDDISCGVSITNLISGISWYQNNKIYRYQRVMDGIYLQNTQDEEGDSLLTEHEDRILDTQETDKFFTSIPAELNLAFAWHFLLPGEQNLTWTTGYSQQFSGNNSTTDKPKIATGFEYSPFSWFKLRAGFLAGGAAGYGSAAGIGLCGSHYAFDLALENKNLFASGSKGLGFAIGQNFFW